MKPIKKIGTCCILSIEKFVVRSNIEAANIIGIAKKNENSVAVLGAIRVIIRPFMAVGDVQPPGFIEKLWGCQTIKA